MGSEPPKRRAISKSLRFEVLKRDCFTCQYCGRRAPDVLLQVDHLRPVRDGGDDGILNLITACADCNAGKGGRPIGENAAVLKAQKQLADLQARREQTETMLGWMVELRDSKRRIVEGLESYWGSLVAGGELTAEGRQFLERLSLRFSVAEICTAMSESAALHLKYRGEEKPTWQSCCEALDRIPGICRRRRKDSQQPRFGDPTKIGR